MRSSVKQFKDRKAFLWYDLSEIRTLGSGTTLKRNEQRNMDSQAVQTPGTPAAQPAGAFKPFLDYAVIVSMALLMALNYQIFILPNAFAPSGLNGLATMIQYLFHFSVGYFSLLINVPLAIACAVFVNPRFALRTLVFTLTFSGALLLMQNHLDMSRFIYHTEDGRSTLLAPVVSGAVNGFIYSMTIRRGASTGGTDFIGEFVHHRDPSYSMMHVVFIINVVIASLSYFVYGYQIEPVALCIIYSLLTTMVSDRFIQSGKRAWKVEMITSHPEEVTQAVIHELKHSTTILQAEGGYSHQGKTMLICVINYHQIAKMEAILRRFPDTFAVVTPASETLGNFRRISRR